MIYVAIFIFLAFKYNQTGVFVVRFYYLPYIKHCFDVFHA